MSVSPAEKLGNSEQFYGNTLTLDDPSSNIWENEGAGPAHSGHTHDLNIVFKMHLVTLKQGVWHEGVGPTAQFSHML